MIGIDNDHRRISRTERARRERVEMRAAQGSIFLTFGLAFVVANWLAADPQPAASALPAAIAVEDAPTLDGDAPTTASPNALDSTDATIPFLEPIDVEPITGFGHEHPTPTSEDVAI